MKLLPLFVLSVFCLCTPACAEEGVPAEKQPAVAPQSARNATRADAPAPVVPGDDDDIYVKHVRTYDLPQNEGKYDLPQRIFVLNLRVVNPAPADNLVLHTNTGIGVMRGRLNSAEVNHYRDIEIACYRHIDDNCEPEALVIFAATAFVKLVDEPDREVWDVLPRLRQDPREVSPFETARGILPPPAEGEKNHILLYYERFFPNHNGIHLIRVTFPPGTRKKYTDLQFGTSAGYLTDAGKEFYKDPRMPDSVVVSLTRPNESWELFPDPGVPTYVPENAGTLGERSVYINEAYAVQGRKKVNLLPRLAQDPFKSLSIHTLQGPLPTVPY